MGFFPAFAQDTIVVDSVLWSNRSGLENVLLGKVSGLNVKSWTGTPGMQSVVNLRGLSMDPTDGSTLPLIMINGVPIIASPSEITAINPLSCFSPEQVDRIEVIKDIARLAAYGVQAPNGAINIVMKEGKTGTLRVLFSAFAGANFKGDFDYKKDAFYNFNTTARREVYQSGSFVHEQNVMIDGGGDYGSYLFGINNHSDAGIIDGTTYSRQSLFFNAKYHITDKFTTRFYNNLALVGRDGRYAGESVRDLVLPVIESERFFMDKKRNVALLSSLDLNYQLSSNLSLKSVVGLSYESARRDFYIPSNILDRRICSYSAAYKRQLLTVNTTLNYLHRFSDKLNLEMVLGNEIRGIDNRLTSVDGERTMEDGGSDFVKIVTGYNAGQTDAFSTHDQENLVSYYGTWNLNLNDELHVKAVLRTDGSSLYEDKWKLYPAFGVNYALNQSLKIPLTVNASIGKTGVLANDEVYRGQLTAYGDYYGGTDLGIGTLYQPFDGAKSVDITQFDAGVTFRASKSFTLSVNYFSKQYRDFTYMRYLPNISGINYQFETGAKLGLSGMEFDVQAKIVDRKFFGWSCGLNMATYRNEGKELPDGIKKTSLSQFQALKNGDAITSFIAYEDGVQKLIGNSAAELFGGFTNTFRAGKLSASMLITYAYGADVIAESFNSRYREAVIGDDFPLKEAETPYYFKEVDENGDVIYQGIRTIEDGSFIRLSSASVSYDLSTVLKKWTALNAAHVFVRGDNLLTLSKYSGFNPEENITGNRRHDMAYTGTPLPLSVVLGLKLQF